MSSGCVPGSARACWPAGWRATVPHRAARPHSSSRHDLLVPTVHVRVRRPRRSPSPPPSGLLFDVRPGLARTSRRHAETAWPVFDPALVTEDTVTLPVQINGKRRGEITVAKDADKDSVEQSALAAEFVIHHLDGASPKKVIVVPNRIVNIVA